MGRRSTNNTKAGKYMNPTDQASKFPPIQFNFYLKQQILKTSLSMWTNRPL